MLQTYYQEVMKTYEKAEARNGDINLE